MRHETHAVAALALKAMVLASCMAMTSGCLRHGVLEQGLRGVVVDELTRAPIAGATVTIEQPLIGGRGRFLPSGETKQRSVVTASDGTFATKPIRYWWIHPMVIPVDPVATFCRITISARSHVAYAEVVETSDFEPMRDMGMVGLARQPAATQP
jgi:hypothetical protein